ncbi:MAG: GTPase Era [Alphaproteobacteria bacterium]|nr:GTPase Era [Alphaproteobacteria bacterium]
MATRCGFVAVIGAPNAGKSTLVNALVGAKVSIVTPKVQTTRARVLGIACKGEVQIVYVDTPGIFAPKRRLERAMVRAAWQGAGDADVVLLMVDVAARASGRDEALEPILAGLRDAKRKAILVLNKIDLVKPADLLAIIQKLNAEGLFTDTFMISALKGDGVADLEKRVIELLPAGPWLYPEDQVADMPLRLLAAEVTREQLFLQLSQELPYSISVETESWQERADGSVRIEQVVHVLRESHKPIVLGKGGQQIKRVGAASRVELEKMLERKVHLFLFVRVSPDWANDPERYQAMGLDFER